MASTITRQVVLVCTKPGAMPPTCDPAIDINADGCAALLTAHLRRRDDATRTDLPLKSGARPFVWTIARLTRAALAWCDSTDVLTSRHMRAVACGMHAYDDAEGKPHAAKVSTDAGFAEADAKWLDDVYDLVGQGGIDELGAAILDWSRVGVRELSPFALPPGLRLAR